MLRDWHPFEAMWSASRKLKLGLAGEVTSLIPGTSFIDSGYVIELPQHAGTFN